MDPRKVGAPGNDTSVVDEFGSEEHILEPSPDEPDVEVVKIVITDRQLASPLDVFPAETPKARVAQVQQTTILDVGDFPLIRSQPAPAAPPKAATAARPPHRRWGRLIRVAAIGSIAVAVAIVAGTA